MTESDSTGPTGPEPGTPEFWAHATPDAPAVVHGDTVLTYREWNERADRVAEGLASLGLGAGDRVGQRFRLSIEWFVVQRALQKLGVAQVAVNWKLTPDEAVHILRDSQAKGLVCNDPDPGGWEAHDVGVLLTVGQEPGSFGARYEDLVETASATPRFGALRPQLVLYTSGTTGAPRGVPPVDPRSVDMQRLERYGASVGSVPPYPEHAKALMTLPVHHGAGPATATAACARGGVAVLLDPYEPEKALELIDRHGIQVWTAVPTMLLRIQSLPEEILDRYDLSSLTALNTGAAAVPPSLKEWVVSRLGEGILWESYGASEAGMISFLRPEDQLRKRGSSGVPYDTVEIAIVDEQWNRLPTGETGEIAVNTPVVLKGYLGGEALGEDTIKDGFYRTGDVGHLDEDGYLFITDRIKDMIVAGGVNVYPAEIEKALVQHPGVVDAAVVGIPHPDFGEQPLAFVVADPKASPSEGDILSFLDGKLAKYKWPRKFEFVEELPVSPMGKVLKNDLRNPYWEGRSRRV